MKTLKRAFLTPSLSDGFLTGLTPNGKTALIAYWQFSDESPVAYSLNSHEQLVVTEPDREPFSPILSLGTTVLLSFNTSAEPLVTAYQNGGNFLSSSSELPPKNLITQTALLRLSDCSFSYSLFSAQYFQKENSLQKASSHFSQFSVPSLGKGQLVWNDRVLPEPVQMPSSLAEMGDAIWETLTAVYKHVSVFTYELNCSTAVTGIRVLQTG